MTVLVSPLWRFLVSDLDGSSITLLDSLATERTVTPKLNEALEVTATVPSDSDYVNRLHTDGYPLVSEGVRQLYCFRKESNTSPYFTIRASTLIMQMDDASRSEDARSRFTAWDPWMYMMSRPVLQTDHAGVLLKTSDTDPGTACTAGNLIPAQFMLYPSTMTADEIVMDLISNTILWGDATAPSAAIDCFVDYGQFGTTFSTNTQETCAAFTDGWPIQQGTSLGQALLDLVATGYLDIVLDPIYDPTNRPGILCSVNIYKQDVTTSTLGAGTFNYNAIFSWDRPGRSLVGVDNLFDGTGRANYVQFYSGQGGPPVAAQSDANTIALYGEYWAQQFFPATNENLPAGVALAAEQLALRTRYKQTLTVHPAPERGPEPFVDYYLGDAVPDYASDNLRQSLPPQTVSAGANALNSATVNVASTKQFPAAGTIIIAGVAVTYTAKTATSFTGCGAHAATVSGEPITSQAWQRIYGIPVDIDDNGTETVRELLVGPVGTPP